MITALLTLVALALFLYLIYYIITLFLPPQVSSVVGIVFGVILVLYVLKIFILSSNLALGVILLGSCF